MYLCPRVPLRAGKSHNLFPPLKKVAGWGKGQVWVQIPALTLVSKWAGHSISLNLRLKSLSYPPRWAESKQARQIWDGR